MEALYYPYARRHISAQRVAEALTTYPSIAAYDGSDLAGFAYCFRFAPDIIELANIYVGPNAREAGLGSIILRSLVAQAQPDVSAIIAVNSDLNPVYGEKRRPDAFYLRNGFVIIASTTSSTVYWWQRA